VKEHAKILEVQHKPLRKGPVPHGYCEITGFADFEITITTSKTLTSTEIANIKKKLPFIEIEMVA